MALRTFAVTKNFVLVVASSGVRVSETRKGCKGDGRSKRVLPGSTAPESWRATMEKERGDATNQAVEDMRQAYELLILTLCWERDRVLKLAEEIARERGQDDARRVLELQAEYIRRQAIR
jgi:hypothetical protein